MPRSCGERIVLEFRVGEMGEGVGGKGKVEEVQVPRVFGWSHVGEDWNPKETVFPSEIFPVFSYLLFIFRKIFKEEVISKLTS